MGISQEQWEKVKEIYEAAIECSPVQRTVYVNRQTKDDVVRAEVLRLLTESDSVGSFLSTPPFVDRRNPRMEGHEQLAGGQLLSGRFRIVSFIAAGGMGEVYQAEDTRLDRTVALKFLPKQLAEDRSALERFRREAKAASALNHPNICTIYDFGEDAGRVFIAMEYLEGETLGNRIKRGPLDVRKAVEVALEVSSGLSAAHQKGIIHRDLKPSNIMLTTTGAKLLDFGLAKYERSIETSNETVTVLTSEAQVLGTLPYMSPEQLKGKDVDARGDIFAFGAVMYEMLTGTRAFERRSSSETIIAVEREEPPPVREIVKEVPGKLEQIVQHCLRKAAGERYGSMAEIEKELKEWREEVQGPANLKRLLRTARRPMVAVPLALAIALLLGVAAWFVHRNMKIRWAREEALPQIAILIEQYKIVEAYALAEQAERYIPQDPVLVKHWSEISWMDSIQTDPPGASVYLRKYNSPSDPWEFVGLCPIEKRRVPAEDLSWRFELGGYATVERATFRIDHRDVITVNMVEVGKAPAGMVRVELATPESTTRPVGLLLPGYENLPAVPLGDFWIDKFEVTNADFKRFVDQGGYQKPEYWKYEFRKEGQVLSWAEAMRYFRDSTGRPGPAGWIGGEYTRGKDNYPVTGVSWFEASAYAEFAGKVLPTVYHWTAAARPWESPSVVPASNFSKDGPGPVGRGMSWSGAMDLAGNVKEWMLNEADPEKRYILGGSWDEPIYLFNGNDARSAFDRSPNFGFRCSKYVLTGESTKAGDPVKVQTRNYAEEKPVSELLFRVYKSFYSYDKTPLHAVVESTEQTNDWKLEKITFDAAYGSQRMVAYLFLPRNASPPFQCVVHFPNSDATNMRSSAETLSLFTSDFDFMIKSGRAVLFPIYEGTFERGGGPGTIYWPSTTSAYRDHVVAWSKDLGRSIDYLETRADIDRNKLAYEGFSWGASLGAILPALESRFRAVALVCPGFHLQNALPEADQINFAPRMKTPVLMLNGRFDFIYPTGTSQDPMFRLLGTPTEHKRRVVYDTAHNIPRNEMVKEILNWLDRYLGQVK
jgi:eukaryotic-like serine/threonine-protein kinase